MPSKHTWPGEVAEARNEHTTEKKKNRDTMSVIVIVSKSGREVTDARNERTTKNRNDNRDSRNIGSKRSRDCSINTFVRQGLTASRAIALPPRMNVLPARVPI